MGCEGSKVDGSKVDPGPNAPFMDWYLKCVLDPDRLQERNGGPVGLKGFAGNQRLNRQLYVAAGRGDAHGVRRLARSGADVNVRLFQLINHYDGSNGQPSGHGVPLSKYRGRWIDQRGDWNKARWGCAGDPAEMTYASRTPLHEAAQRGSADTVAALLELGASPFSRGEGLRTPEDEANHHRSGDFSRCAEMLAAASGGNSATAEEAERWSPPGGVEILRAWYGGPRGHRDVLRRRESAHRNGSWVILNNIHLMPRWLLELEKKLDSFGDASHQNFRLFLSSDPSKGIPIGVLNRCIKLTNEPPGGLKANLKRAFCFFSREAFEEMDSKTKSILFGLCHFHAVMMERKMYGPMGFNMMYPFAIGDLRDSAVILSNYMENSGGGKIPWQDLKYLFGEIMYGGHIVNDFDRLLCGTYLDFFMKDELLDEAEMYPYAEDEKGTSFMCPAPTSYEKYLEHIDVTLTTDTPVAFGLHPNAEIDFRTTQSEVMFRTLVELQPRTAGGDSEGAMSPTEIANAKLDDIMDRFGEKRFDVDDLSASLDEKGPYQNVFLQEMEVMNKLLGEIVRSLKELALGFKGELTMSDAMEAVMNSLYMDTVPGKWVKFSWPSRKALSGWLTNFMARLTQLEDWSNNPAEIPKCTFLSYLVNPQSFLTAVNQVAAQKNQWELDKLVSFSDVTRYATFDKVEAVSREGAYITGLNMQGARWDVSNAVIDRSKPKEMFCAMPVMSVKGLAIDKADFTGMYNCPVYKTEQRGPTFVYCANLRTKSPFGRWVLAGVALILELTT